MRKSNCLFSKLKSRILLALTVFALAFAVAGCDSPAGWVSPVEVELTELQQYVGTYKTSGLIVETMELYSSEIRIPWDPTWGDTADGYSGFKGDFVKLYKKGTRFYLIYQLTNGTDFTPTGSYCVAEIIPSSNGKLDCAYQMTIASTGDVCCQTIEEAEEAICSSGGLSTTAYSSFAIQSYYTRSAFWFSSDGSDYNGSGKTTDNSGYCFFIVQNENTITWVTYPVVEDEDYGDEWRERQEYTLSKQSNGLWTLQENITDEDYDDNNTSYVSWIDGTYVTGLTLVFDNNTISVNYEGHMKIKEWYTKVNSQPNIAATLY